MDSSQSVDPPIQRRIFERIEDADVVVSTESQLTALCVRKQNIYTEQRVFPYVEASDLRMDLLPAIRTMPRENEPDTLGTA